MADTDEIQLPPVLEKLREDFAEDRRRLMKDPAFDAPKQMRLFIGMYLYPRMEQLLKLLAAVSLEAYAMAASNVTENRKLYNWVAGQLSDLGANVDPVQGMSMESLEPLQHALYKLGAVLEAKLPGDEEAQEAFNGCAVALAAIIEEMMTGSYSDDDGDDYDDDDDDDDDGDDGDDGSGDSPDDADDDDADADADESDDPKDAAPTKTAKESTSEEPTQ